MGYGIEINEEIKSIMNHLNEKKFYILTKRLVELEKEIAMCITIDIPGAIIYGRSRAGKTKAITYLKNTFGTSYGADIPIITWDITDHTVTEKQFYSSFIKAIGLPDPKIRETALVLKTRIVNTLVVIGGETKYRTIILLVDEASELDERDFVWLMDLYNSLAHHNITLITFMFGTIELKALKESFKTNGKNQIIARFMAKEIIFKGICNEGELQQCLLALDQPMTIDLLEGKKIILPQYFFPDAYEDGKYFGDDLTGVFWNAYMKVMAENGIPLDSDIPMQYFFTPLKNCLAIYGKGGPKEKYYPEQKDLEECIASSGYLETECLQSRPTKKKRK